MRKVLRLVLSIVAFVGGFRAFGEEPLARFGLVSDVHLQTNNAHRIEMLRRSFSYFDQRRADGVVVCGDLTQDGLIDELLLFGRLWDEAFPCGRRSDGESVERLFVYGDHDVENFFKPRLAEVLSPEELEALRRADIPSNDRAIQWRRAFHEPFAPIVRKRVKGFDFVLAHLVNLDEPGMRYADPLHIPGLEEFFATNAFDAVRPFFYVQHKIPRGTVGGPTQTGQDAGRTSAILSRYPNAVAFNGHKHRSAAEELSLWQGSFTAVQVPALMTLLTAAGRENGRCSCDARKVVPTPQMPVLDTVPDGSHLLLLSVFSDRLVFERVDIVHDGEPVAAPWVVRWPNDGSSAFDRRGADVPAPRFPEGSCVSVSRRDGRDRRGVPQRQVEVRFPAARSTERTPRGYDYEVSAVLTKALVTRIVSQKRVYSPKCYWPERYDTGDVTCVFAETEIPNDHDAVRFVVRPLNAWGRVGDSIESAAQRFDPARPLCWY